MGGGTATPAWQNAPTIDQVTAVRCTTLADLPRAPAGKSGWPWTAESATVADVTPAGHSWPRVSVVTPSYNQAEFIESTIRSVLLQGYPNLEYIVIDGGSDDGSEAIISKYRPWLSYVVSKPDDGQIAAINEGFSVANGAVMTWLNSDDLFAPNSLWAVGGIFGDLGHTVKWLTGTPAMLDRAGNLGLVLVRPKLDRWLLRLGAYDGLTLNFIQQEGTFWSRDLWLRSGGYLETALPLAADYELWCRLADHADLYGASALLAGFRVHPAQKTAYSMSRYMHEMEVCRATRRWGFTQRNRVVRGVKRRLERAIYRLSRTRNLVMYSPRDMKWEIVH
jgi:glycosyltransferase involved in cell wall biosynthesis